MSKKSNAFFEKNKDPFYKKQKYTKGLHSLKQTQKILKKVNPDVSGFSTRQDFMQHSRLTQRELDNESQYNHQKTEQLPDRNKMPMAYLIREFQKSLNNGDQDTAGRNKEVSSSKTQDVIEMLKLDLGKNKQLQHVPMNHREFEKNSDREINRNFNRYVKKNNQNKNDFANLYLKVSPRPCRAADH